MSAALGAEPFTVFAASNEAFKKLPVGAFVGLLKPESRDELARTLKYQAIAGRVTSRELDGKKFNRKSAGGAELPLDETGGATVDKVKVKGSEIEASNGVIHDIDSVLIPLIITGKRRRDLPYFLPVRTLNPKLEEADLSHKFTIGQTVHLTPSNTRSAVAGDYEVRHLMPASDYQSEPRYRVKNLAERHERVVTESDLTLPQETANL